MMSEGSRVVYVGDDPMVGVGTQGKILSHGGTGYEHVQWASGSRMGTVDPIAVEDLIPHRGTTVAGIAAPGFEDSLGYESTLHVAVRDTYDDLGEDGLLNALDEAGHIATLSAYADDALMAFASRVRQDPDFSHILSHLDDQEAEGLVSRVVSHLLQNDRGD